MKSDENNEKDEWIDDEDVTSIWMSLASQSPVWKHEGLRSQSLPDLRYSSKYAVDLAAAMTGYIKFEILGVKLRSFESRRSWSQLAPVISYVLALRELAIITNQCCVVSSANAEYLMDEIDALVPGLGEIIVRADATKGHHDVEALTRAIRSLDAIVSSVNGKFGRRAKDPRLRFAAVTAEIEGGLAAVQHFWPFISSGDTTEMFRPLLSSD